MPTPVNGSAIPSQRCALTPPQRIATPPPKEPAAEPPKVCSSKSRTPSFPAPGRALTRRPVKIMLMDSLETAAASVGRAKRAREDAKTTKPEQPSARKHKPQARATSSINTLQKKLFDERLASARWKSLVHTCKESNSTAAVVDCINQIGADIDKVLEWASLDMTLRRPIEKVSERHRSLVALAQASVDARIGCYREWLMGPGRLEWLDEDTGRPLRPGRTDVETLGFVRAELHRAEQAFGKEGVAAATQLRTGNASPLDYLSYAQMQITDSLRSLHGQLEGSHLEDAS